MKRRGIRREKACKGAPFWLGVAPFLEAFRRFMDLGLNFKYLGYFFLGPRIWAWLFGIWALVFEIALIK